MTTTGLSRKILSKAGGAGLFERIGAFLSRSRAERQLSELDDRLLADIGLKRSDIQTQVWDR